MRRRMLAAALACTLLAGCGPVRTEPVEQETPRAGAPVIAYVPLDDRPDNAERVVYLAESLGYELAMPERDLYRTRLDGQPPNENGTQYGDRGALYEWVAKQEAAGCDRYILSLDQLLSGGLVSSRAMTGENPVTLSSGETLVEAELLTAVIDLLAADENNRIWLLDTVMRLAATTGYGGFGLNEYNALRTYGMAPRPHLEGTDLTIGNIVADYPLGADGTPVPVEAEEPLLNVSWEERLEEIRVHILGTVQLEILQELMAERFRRKIRFGECQVSYRETIGNTVLGCGHFEPLRHYAEVHLALSPGKRGSGITFESKCPFDQLDRSYQNLIRTHVFERELRGVLIGAPLTDVRVTLLAGKAHEKHTEGGDFREAVYRALRQGLMQVESILLEPWYAFRIQADSRQLGRILSDIQRLQGVFEPPRQQENRVTVNGRGPAAGFINYSRELAAFTKGKGMFSFRFDGYEPCQNQEELAARFSYDPEADLEYTPDSVFCSHGAGYPVKWHQAREHMHLKVSLP